MALSREQLERNLKNKPFVELDDLVQLIEDNFGYSVTLKKKRIVSSEQKKQLASAIFKNEGVLSQLRQSKRDKEAGISTYSDSDEEFERPFTEADNAK
jgi:hypothetical protein